MTTTRRFDVSPGDRAFLRRDDFLREKSEGAPVDLVLDIRRSARVHDDRGGERCDTGNLRSRTFLDLGSRFFNRRGDRIEPRDE